MPLLLELPPGYRQRALADLDRLIARLEDGGGAPPQRCRPAVDPDHLALLRRTRQFLLAGRLARERDGQPPAYQDAA